MAGRRQPVIPPPLVILLGVPPLVQLDDEPLLEQPLDRRVQRSGVQLRPAACPLRDLLHDAVAMAVSVGKSDQDMESGRREGKQAFEIVEVCHGSQYI